jgi:hypothetical protein
MEKPTGRGADAPRAKKLDTSARRYGLACHAKPLRAAATQQVKPPRQPAAN